MSYGVGAVRHLVRHCTTRRTSPTRRAPTPCTTLYDASYAPDASGPDALYDAPTRRTMHFRQHSTLRPMVQLAAVDVPLEQPVNAPLCPLVKIQSPRTLVCPWSGHIGALFSTWAGAVQVLSWANWRSVAAQTTCVCASDDAPPMGGTGGLFIGAVGKALGAPKWVVRWTISKKTPNENPLATISFSVDIVRKV